MKQLAIVSGKGGTGKTSITAGLIHLAAQESILVIADADVDAANMALLLSPTDIETNTFMGGKLASIDSAQCTSCGICREVCQFDAVILHSNYHIDPLACEGCAACYYQCPVDAITMSIQTAGIWKLSKTSYGPLYHAHLYAGQENSGKLVTLVKQKAKQHAIKLDANYLFVDGPPGIGCPVIATIAGADLILIITEPSLTGIHDMKRVAALAEHFNLPYAIIINKYDIDQNQSDEIAKFCTTNSIPIAGQIPFDLAVTEMMVRGVPISKIQNPVTTALKEAWYRVQNYIEE